jgi:hypothetical protein
MSENETKDTAGDETSAAGSNSRLPWVATPARDKEAAIALITSAKARLVDLDYEAGNVDVIELGKLGREHGVAVMYRSQELIIVPSLPALRSRLASKKDSWRARTLMCQFDLATVPATEIGELRARAADLHDLIVPLGAVLRADRHLNH